MIKEDPSTLVPCRAETLLPLNNWDLTWSNARMKGLDSYQTSFMFKLLHNILPTRSRLSRMRIIGHTTNWCRLCDVNEEEDQIHAFFSCSNNRIAGLALLGYIQRIAADLSEADCLCLNLGANLDEVQCLAAVSLIATGLRFIWERRIENKTVPLYLIRAELEAKIELLRRTRYDRAGELMHLIVHSS